GGKTKAPVPFAVSLDHRPFAGLIQYDRLARAARVHHDRAAGVGAAVLVERDLGGAIEVGADEGRAVRAFAELHAVEVGAMEQIFHAVDLVTLSGGVEDNGERL